MLRRVLAAVAVGTLLLVLAAVVVPDVRAVAKAPFVLADAFDAPAPRPWAPSVERSEDVLDGVVVDRWAPADAAPPVLLVPGAAPAGRDDPRVTSLAESLARAGREVVVPELLLYDQRLDVADVDRVVRTAAALCRPDRGVVLFGFSFGGSLALVAAADDRLAGCVELVATFGAYADLVGVLQAAVTGTSVVDGERYRWPDADDPAVREVLRDAATALAPQPQRQALRSSLQESDPTGLSGDARAVYDLMTAEEPEQVRALVQELPPRGRDLVEALSPVSVADRISVPVLAAHALDDPAVPYAELLRLRRALPEAETMTVESFRHVDLAPTGDLGTILSDLLTAWDLMQEVLAPQEQWPWESAA